MNWGRAKSILLIMFILVDIFLAIVLAETRSSVSRLSEETVAATVRVLEQRGLSLDPAVVPLERTANRNIVMRNHFENPLKAAETMLEDFAVQKQDEAQRDYQFEDKNAFLHVNRAGVFYSEKREKDPYKEGNRPSDDAMQNKVKQELDKLGFNKKQMAVQNGRWDSGVYHCSVLPVFDEVIIYGINMQVTVDRHGILNLEGAWFRPDAAEQFADERLMDVTAVLTGLVYREDCQNMKIVKLENAFYAGGDYLQSREISAVPVYVVTSASGRRLYFDGRTGNEITQ